MKERIKLIEISFQLVKNPENLPFVTLAVTAAQEGVSGLSLVTGRGDRDGHKILGDHEDE